MTRMSFFSVYFLFLLIISLSPVWGYCSVRPLLYMVPLFFCSLFPPTSLFPFLIFSTSLFLDSLLGQPLGITGVEWLSLFYSVVQQRRILRNGGFICQWIGFAFFLIINEVLHSGFLFLSNGGPFWSLSYLTTSALSSTLTFLTYPLLVWPLYRESTLSADRACS